MLFSLSCNHKLTVCFDRQWFSTSNVFLAIAWANQAFSFVSVFLCELTECVCLLRRWVFHTQFSESLACRPFFFYFLFTAMPCHQSESKTKLWSACSFISLTHLSLTRHWSLRELFVHAITFIAACLCLVLGIVKKNYWYQYQYVDFDIGSWMILFQHQFYLICFNKRLHYTYLRSALCLGVIWCFPFKTQENSQ